MARTLAFLVSLLAASAAAQDGTADDEAHALFEAAEHAYADGRYENALEYFRRAYELSGRADLLYNVGLAAERMRHDADAVDAYERYLEARPDSPHRAAIEARLEILHAAIERAAADEEAVVIPPEVPPESPPPPLPTETFSTETEPRPAAGPNGGAIAITAIGGVLAATGVVLAALAAADTASVEGATFPARWSDVAGAHDRAFPESVAGWTLVGAGVATLIGGVLWLVLDVPSTSTEIVVGPGGASVRGTF